MVAIVTETHFAGEYVDVLAMLLLCLVHARPLVDEHRMTPNFHKALTNNFAHAVTIREPI